MCYSIFANKSSLCGCADPQKIPHAFYADRAKENKEENMTITLDEEYFAVASDALLGYCGETNARTIVFAGLDNVQADAYSLVLSYDDGECYETRITNNSVTLTSGIMRKSGSVDVQVYACCISGDNYTVVKKSNIIQMLIKPSLDADAQPVPAMADCLRLLDTVQRCTQDLTDLAARLIEDQEELERIQTQILEYMTEINAAVRTVRSYVAQIQSAAEQIFINKSALGLEKRNLLKISSTGFNDGHLSMRVNGDGELILNGTSNAPSYSATEIPLCASDIYDDVKHIPNGKYILSNNAVPGVYAAVIGYKYTDHDTIEQQALAYCTDGSDVEFTVDDEYPYNYVILDVAPVQTHHDSVVRPLIRYKGITDSSWEPYKPDLQTQINELRAMIEAGGGYNETQVDTVYDSIEEVNND